MTTFKITEKGGDQLTAWLTGLESKYHAVYLERVGRVVEMLLARVKEKLSGESLQVVTGRLLASIKSDVLDSDDLITGHVYSDGSVPYAAIQERGGLIGPHWIFPREAQALRFEVLNEAVFAGAVHHPGARIPPHEYLRGTMVEMRSEIRDLIKKG